MKKAVSILLALVMAFCVMTTVMAQPTETAFNGIKIVKVTGRVESANATINVMLKEGNSVVSDNEVKADKDGNYSCELKFIGDGTGKTIQVMQEKNNVTDSVVSAIAQDEPYSCTLKAESASLLAKTESYYNSLAEYTAVFAYYDNNNRLQKVIANNEKTKDDPEIFEDDFKFPENTQKIKVFIWNDKKIEIPLAEKVEKKGTIKLLAFGNSHTADAFSYLPEIMEEGGYEFIGHNAMINGATFLTHYNAMINNSAAYEIDGKKYTMEQLLSGDIKYDYVVITSTIDFSDSDANFAKHSDEIAKFIRNKQPDAEIIVHHTWAYEDNSPDAKFIELYGGDRSLMNKAMKERNEYLCQSLAGVRASNGKKVSLNGKPLRRIPSGDAFWLASQDEMFKTRHSGEKYWADGHWWCPYPTDERGGSYTTLYRDSYHASVYHGKYLVALTWYAALTGESVLDNTYTNEKYPINEMARPVINKAAQDAVDQTGVW